MFIYLFGLKEFSLDLMIKFKRINKVRRLFLTSYKVIGPVRNFYMFLPKEEQEASRKLWERRTKNETNANK